MSEDRILPSEGRTELKIPIFAPKELDVECTPDCPRSSKSFSNGNSEQKSGSPIGIRALFNVDNERPELRNRVRSALRRIINRNGVEQCSSSPSRSRSPLRRIVNPNLSNPNAAEQCSSSPSRSRSPLRRIVNPNSSFRNSRSSTTPTPTSDYGRKKRRASVEEAVPHPSSTHHSPEVCDANIASIIYSSPSQEKRIAPAPQNRKFPWFWKRNFLESPECHLEKKRTAFLLSEAKEQKRLRIENARKEVEQGKHGKSSIERQVEWEKGLRKYDSCSSWQRHIGHDTRKRYQRKLIKAAVQEQPFSKLQELRTDAITMENELFRISKDMDDYKAKTRQIVNVFQTRLQSQRDKEEATETETPQRYKYYHLKLSKNAGRESVAKARGILKEFISVNKSLFWGNGQDSPTSTEESIPATPCNCKEKETRLMCQFQNERIRIGKEDFRFQNVDTLNRPNSPKKYPYQPKLKRVPPSYRDRTSAVGWNHKPPKDVEQFVDDFEYNMRSGPRDELYANKINKLHGHPPKVQFSTEQELDDDEWSIIDAMGLPKFANLCTCFG